MARQDCCLSVRNLDVVDRNLELESSAQISNSFFRHLVIGESAIAAMLESEELRDFTDKLYGQGRTLRSLAANFLATKPCL
jgi:hypothetical protein